MGEYADMIMEQVWYEESYLQGYNKNKTRLTMNVSGTVSNISSRDVNTKRGMAQVWSVALQGQDGFHGFGFKKPPVNKGDKVSFVSEKNERGYLTADTNTLVVVPATEEVRSNSPTEAVAKDSKPGYWDSKAIRDIQNDLERKVGATRNTAIEWVKFLMANGAFPKLPPATKLEQFFNDLLESYMVKFGVGESTDAEPIEPQKPKKAPAAKAVPTEEEEEDADDWS